MLNSILHIKDDNYTIKAIKGLVPKYIFVHIHFFFPSLLSEQYTKEEDKERIFTELSRHGIIIIQSQLPTPSAAWSKYAKTKCLLLVSINKAWNTPP